MKRLSILLFLLTAFVFAKAQYPIQQSVGNAPNTKVKSNAVQVADGFINGVFVDTTAANLKQIKAYPGAQIFTTSDSSFWLRNPAATRWLKANAGAGSITSFTFVTDSSLIICYGDGTCDTIPINNFSEIVNNIVQNFNDSSITFINDSTIIICNSAGSCDTVHLGNSNTYNFFISGDTTFLVTCDTVQVICVGDSCYQQQVCDTIALTAPLPINIYQNDLYQYPPGNHIIERGRPSNGAGAGSLIHDTWTYTNGFQYTVEGAPPSRPPFAVNQGQWSQLSSSIMQLHHYGAYHPGWGLLDDNNPVNLYFNYTNPLAIPTQGTLVGDTVGFMGSRYGYMLMTNAKGTQNAYSIDDVNAKQTGIFFDTYTPDSKGVGIFAQQVPSPYAFNLNPPTDSTLESKVGLWVKTDRDIQLPNYPNTRNDGVANKAIIPLDTDGNLGVGSVVASTSIVEIISDSSFRVCDLNGVCDTFVVDISDPTVINVFNDTTIIICNEAGSCDTITVNNYTITNGQMINVGNTLFVSKAGNDATGQRQRVDLHFLTIRAALAAAFPGDVIVVFPGTYEENAPINLAKSVNYHFIGKGDLRLTTSVAAGAIFTDSATVCYSKIWGEHWTFTARSSQKVLYQTGASTVEMVADSITSASGSTINTASSSNAKTKITANYMYANSFLGNLWIQGRNFYGDIDFIEAGEFGVPVWINNCASFVLHSKKIFSQNPLHAEYIIEVGSSTATDSIYIDADEIYAQLEWAVWAQGLSPNIYINAQRISANSDCVVVSSDLGMLTVKADIIEDRATGTIDGVVHGEGGNLTVINARITNASASGADVLTRNLGGQDGTVKLNSVVYNKSKVTEVTPGTIKRIDSLYYGSNFQFTNARMETDTAQVVAANNLELGRANVNLVSGATQITAIYSAGWQAGSASVHLVFSGAPLVKNNTAGGAGTATILLAGLTDFQAAAGDVLSLLFDGTNWRETNRTLTASAGGVTADNGLTANTATNVQLGGTLIQSTTIDGNGQAFLITSSDLTQATIRIESNGTNAHTSFFENFGFGSAIVATGHNNAAIQANAINDNYALLTQSNSATSNYNGIVPGIQISGAGSNNLGTDGIGVSIDLRAGTSGTGAGYYLANQIISKFPTANTPTRTSQLIFTGVTSGTTETWLTIGQSGYVKFRPMTVTEAGAIATAEGLMVFVSNTDATFTSIGLWIYQNGAWHAL